MASLKGVLGGDTFDSLVLGLQLKSHSKMIVLITAVLYYEYENVNYIHDLSIDISAVCNKQRIYSYTTDSAIAIASM